MDQLSLTIAVNPGNTDDFSPLHPEAYVIYKELGVTFHAGLDGQMLHFQNGPVRLCLGLFHGETHLSPHHHLRHLLFGNGIHLHGTDIFSTAQHRAPVSYRLDFFQFMGNEQDGFPLCHQTAHDLHKFVYLLGRQHRSGLIKDHDFIVPVQHFEDLHPLLHAHGDVFHPGVQIHL